ncbi:hypothetical protein [Evansella clarkii]|uniref:hypothetical protein n=1 Tax=Evansella clarkii TaxID=79879 RepID=UPI0009970875|nr:hypothetical protein [Evansella clarkii]
MNDKTWGRFQLLSFLLIVTMVFLLLYVGPQYPVVGETLQGNYILAGLLILIFICLLFILIIGEVRRRVGHISKEASLVTLAGILVLVILAYTSV